MPAALLSSQKMTRPEPPHDTYDTHGTHDPSDPDDPETSMDTWQITPTPPHLTASAGLRCASGLIAHLGDDTFAQAGLACPSEALQAASWSVYQV